MGVIDPDVNLAHYLRGSLIKFNGIMAVDFKDENFYNIGAFTLEHLNYVL